MQLTEPLEKRLPARPVTVQERLDLLDVMRGFAILGILVVNISGMKSLSWYSRLMLNQTEAEWTTNRVVDETIGFLAEGRFITILSLLFGLGFGMLLEKSERTGDRFLLHRRLVFLLLLGLAHGFFLWHGDVLTLYAIAGFFLLLLRHCQPRKLFIRGSVLLAIGAVGVTGWVLVMVIAANIFTEQSADEWLRGAMIAAERVYATGTFGEITRQRAFDFFLNLSFNTFWMPATVGLFAFGMAAWKAGLPARLIQSEAVVHGVLSWALPAAVVLSIGQLVSNVGWMEVTISNMLVVITVTFLAPIAAAITYLALIAHCWNTRIGQTFLRVLVPVGRMALTNYLLQSIITTSIFYGYGLGLFGKVSALQGLAVVVSIWVFQIILSHIWLKWFTFGPLEWCLRRWTYSKS